MGEGRGWSRKFPHRIQPDYYKTQLIQQVLTGISPLSIRLRIPFLASFSEIGGGVRCKQTNKQTNKHNSQIRKQNIKLDSLHLPVASLHDRSDSCFLSCHNIIPCSFRNSCGKVKLTDGSTLLALGSVLRWSTVDPVNTFPGI